MPKTSELDIVIPVRDGDQNPELCYALRSIEANLPHRRIILVGNQPVWTTNTGLLTPRKTRDKHFNTTEAMRAACLDPDISDPFIWSNDDIYILKPLTDLGVYNRGTVKEVIADYTARIGRSAYLTGMKETLRLLNSIGHTDPLSYELHVPIVIHKQVMLDALALNPGISVYHKRTVYGALLGKTGRRINDPKVRNPHDNIPTGSTFLSTEDRTFKATAERLEQMFPHPCRYETAYTPPMLAVDPYPAPEAADPLFQVGSAAARTA